MISRGKLNRDRESLGGRGPPTPNHVINKLCGVCRLLDRRLVRHYSGPCPKTRTWVTRPADDTLGTSDTTPDRRRTRDHKSSKSRWSTFVGRFETTKIYWSRRCRSFRLQYHLTGSFRGSQKKNVMKVSLLRGKFENAGSQTPRKGGIASCRSSNPILPL